MRFFGQDIENLETDQEVERLKPGPRNLLSMLPEVFTYEEAVEIRKKQGMSPHGTGSMLANWKTRQYIDFYGERMPKENIYRQRYIKTKNYLNGNLNQ